MPEEFTVEQQQALWYLVNNRINNAVNQVFYDTLKAFGKSGDDLLLPHSFNEAIGHLADDLVFMLLNNPTVD